MKNCFSILILFASLLSPLCQGQILVGVKGGYNYITLIGNSNTNPHHDASFNVDHNNFLISFFVKDRQHTKTIHLGGELQYFQENISGNQSIGGNGSGEFYDYQFNLNFLNLIVKPEFVFGSNWSFIINSGIYLSILIDGNATGQWTTYGSIPMENGIINDKASKYFNSCNLGFLVGVGLEHTFGKRIVINLSSDGLIGVTKLANGSLTEKFLNNFSCQISCGIAYMIHSRNKKEGKKSQPDLDDVYN
jgi:hypothetical protein